MLKATIATITTSGLLQNVATGQRMDRSRALSPHFDTWRGAKEIGTLQRFARVGCAALVVEGRSESRKLKIEGKPLDSC